LLQWKACGGCLQCVTGPVTVRRGELRGAAHGHGRLYGHAIHEVTVFPTPWDVKRSHGTAIDEARSRGKKAKKCHARGTCDCGESLGTSDPGVVYDAEQHGPRAHGPYRCRDRHRRHL